MWVRWIGSPWWVRWLLTALLLAFFVGPIVTFTAPHLAGTMGRTWGLVWLVGFSVTVAGLMTAIAEPIQRTYRVALADLSGPHRRQSVRALRGGE